ncbi:SagB/ThcOx family dehydrogenase [Corynebacterium variabile]|uniref:SagB/ThcOx family dehydrogenase n=1 Tax=Corynebacterium variabile TaxID=1727 RepID=UPI003FD2D6F5
MDSLHVSKTFTVEKSEEPAQAYMSFGQGSEAQTFSVSAGLAAAILASPGKGTFETWKKYFCKALELDPEEAGELVNTLTSIGLLGDSSVMLTPNENQWLEIGWSDALHEHWKEHDTIWLHDYRNNPKVMTITNGENVVPDTPPPGPSYAIPLKGHDLVMMPPATEIDKSFREAVRSRRTSYNFRSSDVSMRDLSSILRWTMKGQWTDGVAPLRVSQSYSRGEPFIAYVLAGKNARSELTEGIVYQYDAVAESLVPVSDKGPSRWSEILWGQDFADEAPVTIVLAAQWMHYMWKYRSARGYRWVFTECGAFMQTLLTAATSLGYRTWQTPALDDFQVADILRQEPREVEALYLVALGKK